MKSTHQLKYETLIISMIISREQSKTRQVALLMDFHQKSHIYYETLCSALYELSMGRRDTCLCLSPSGEPFFSDAGKDSENSRVLFYPAEVPEFEDDLVDQLEFAFQQINNTFVHKLAG